MKHTVGVADMVISSAPGDIIVTHALGSCLGITVHDPVAGVGGLLHVMLPASTIDESKAEVNPCMFVDTGVPLLFRASYQAGAQKNRLTVKVAGGACIGSRDADSDFFQIGKRNVVALRRLLWKNGVLVAGEDVGGSEARTLSLDLATGEVVVRMDGHAVTL